MVRSTDFYVAVETAVAKRREDVSMSAAAGSTESTTPLVAMPVRIQESTPCDLNSNWRAPPEKAVTSTISLD